MSPNFGIELGQVLKKSKLLLNIHFEDINTFEVPRIIEGIAHGKPIVTEYSSLIKSIMPERLLIFTEYDSACKVVIDTLNDDKLEFFGSENLKWYRDIYGEFCFKKWIEILEMML